MKYPTVLFSIDGMRPDGILQSDTPCFHRLIETGSSTLKAQTVMPSVTLPCHTSMLRGVDVGRHGITTNTFQPLARPVPSLFDVARTKGLTTGFFYNWGELRDLMAADSALVEFSYSDPSFQDSDWIVAKAASEQVAKASFDLLFVYLGFVDTSGHEFGWMSKPYLDAISVADRCVQYVLDAFTTAGQTPNVLVLSDHGGHERSHGTEMPEDMTIPWVLNGPSIRKGFQISAPVRIFDTCTTLAALCGLAPAKAWDGRIVMEAFI